MGFEDFSDLFEEILCDICGEEFDEDEKLPKVLPCGHSFCHSCLRTKEPTIFPKCCSQCDFCNSYTNYGLLQILKKLKQNKLCENHRKLECLKSEIISTKKALLRAKDENIKILDSNLEKIETLLNNPDEINENSLLEIENIEKEVRSIINVNFDPKIIIEPSNKSSSFLIEICRKLNLGETLHTIHQRNTKTFSTEFLCGKISVTENFLYFHCLEQREPKHDQKFIRFDDLKRATGSMVYKIFLTINSKYSINRMILINPLESFLLHNFFELCIGENGTSYKNMHFKADVEPDHRNRLIGKSFIIRMENFIKRDFVPLYTINMEKPSHLPFVDSDNIFVLGYSDGSFKIISLTDEVAKSSTKIIGKVENPAYPLCLITEDSKIVDCGIAFCL